MMAQGHVFVHLMLLCLWWCIDVKFQGVNAQNVTISKVQPNDPKEGDVEVDLRCNATNLKPGDDLEWSRLDMNAQVTIRSGLDITKYTRFTASSSEQYVVDVLRINALRRDDAGTYDCTVKNYEGTIVATASIYLTVRYFPSAEYPLCSPNGSFTAQEGTAQQFTCTTERGSPSVSMLIQKNGTTTPQETLYGNATTFTRSHNFTFTEDDHGKSIECKIISWPFESSCRFGPITVTMQDNGETMLPSTVENRPTLQTDATSEGSDTSSSTWAGTTIGSSQRTPNSSNPSPGTSNPTIASQETSNPSIPSRETINPTIASQETSNPSTPSQETPSQPVLYTPIVLIVGVVGGSLIFLLLIPLIIVCCCCKKNPRSRQPQINLPLFQPTTDLVFEPQGSHLVIHQESTIDKVDMTEKDDTSEEMCADQNPKPDVMLVSHSPNTEPEDKQSSSIKNGGLSPADVDEKKIQTFKPRPERTADTADSKEGHGEVLHPHEPHESTPMTGEVVYSEVSSQQRVPQVSSGHTTYADLDLPPCTSDTVPLPKDQTLYARISDH